jgi:3-isopropylmalate/(R)-2-methylmalate dehydratase small subunit
MQRVDVVRGRAVPLVLDDIDTDRIIPARFLRCVTFDGLGEHAFEDDRRQDAKHPFSDSRFRGASILIAGRNFGCGSSREHAPQSLMRWGIRGIVAESYAEIFFGNCTSLGIPAVTASRADLERLAAAVEASPEAEVVLDVEKLQMRCGEMTIACHMPDATRESLVSGQWDFLGQLLDGERGVERTAAKIPYLQGFAK